MSSSRTLLKSKVSNEENKNSKKQTKKLVASPEEGPWKRTIKATVADIRKEKDFYKYLVDEYIGVGDFEEDTMLLDGLHKWLYVTFKNEKTAMKAIDMKHDPDDSNITNVELATSRDFDTYPNLLFLYGYDDICELKDLISNETGLEVEDIDVHDEPKAVVIIFGNCLDITQLTWELKKLNGTEMITAPVYKENSILISGLNNSIPEAHLLRYMKNKKRSGGGEIQSLTYLGEEEAVLTFVNETDLLDVLKLKGQHAVGGTKLEVSNIYPCLTKNYLTKFISDVSPKHLKHSISSAANTLAQKNLSHSQSEKVGIETSFDITGSLGLKDEELHLLEKSNFLSDLRESIKSVKVIFDHDNAHVIIKGNDKSEIFDVQIKILNICRNDIAEISVNHLVPEQQQFLRNKEVLLKLNSMLTNAYLMCSGPGFKITYIKSSEDSKKLLGLVDSQIFMHRKSLTSDMVNILQSRKGQTFLSELGVGSNDGDGSPKIELDTGNKSLLIIGPNERVVILQKDIEIFLELNQVFIKEIPFSQGKLQFMKQYMQQEFDSIQLKSGSDVDVQHVSNKFIIKGLKDPVEECFRSLTHLSTTILNDELKLEYFGIQEFLQDEEGSRMLEDVQEKNNCLIIAGSEDSYDLNLPQSVISGSFNLIAKAKIDGAVTLSFIQGSLLDVKVDVIVNPLESSLKLTSSLSKAIIKQGGSTISADLNFSKSYNNLIFKTTSGNLSDVKSILHVKCPVYNESDTTKFRELRESVRSCLEFADNNGCNSIGFPAVGCDKTLKFPPLAACNYLMRDIVDFAESKRTSLRHIYLCDNKEEVVNKLIERFEAVSTNHKIEKCTVKNKKEKDISEEHILTIYSKNSRDIKVAIDFIEKFCKKCYKESIERDDRFAKKLSIDHIKELKQFGLQKRIKVTNQADTGFFKMEGFSGDDIFLVEKKMQRLILEILEIDKHNNALHKSVQSAIIWQYKKGEKWYKFEPIINSELEHKYQQEENDYEFTDENGDKMEIDFRKLKAYLIDENDQEADQYDIKRQDLTKDITELTWTLTSVGGNKMITAPVYKNNCVSVSGLTPDVSIPTLKRYLENKKRSGGGKTKSLVQIAEDEVVVYFEDDVDLTALLSKEDHAIELTDLIISCYYPCLSRNYVKKDDSLKVKPEKNQPLPSKTFSKKKQLQVTPGSLMSAYAIKKQGPIFIGMLTLTPYAFLYLKEQKYKLENIAQEAYCEMTLFPQMLQLKLKWPFKIEAKEVKQKLENGCKEISNYLNQLAVLTFTMNESEAQHFQHFCTGKVDILYLEESSKMIVIRLDTQTSLKALIHHLYDEFIQQGKDQQDASRLIEIKKKLSLSEGAEKINVWTDISKAKSELKVSVEEKTLDISKAKSELKVSVEEKTFQHREEVSLDKFEIKLLEKCLFFDQFKETYKETKINLDYDTNKLILMGNDKSQLDAIHFEILNKCRQDVGFSKLESVTADQMKLLKKDNVQKKVDSMLNNCYMQCNENDVKLYYLKSGSVNISDAEKKIRSQVEVTKKIINQDMLKILESSDGSTFLSSLTDHNSSFNTVIQLDSNNQELLIICPGDQIYQLNKSVDNYLETNKLHQKEISLSYGKQQFINKYLMEELNHLKSSLGRDATLEFLSDKCLIKRLRDPVSICEVHINKLVSKIDKNDVQLNFFGIDEFLHDSEGKSLLRDIEETHRCVIQFKSEAKKAPAPKVAIKPPTLIAKCSLRDVNISFFQGNIFGLNADAVVNPLDSSFQFVSAINRELIQQ
ncbi:poly [ADP-ribose] polymerase 14, partial [Biomphalaria pfeifferi]